MEAIAETTLGVKKVPALRFPEFSEEWDQKRFGDITNRISDPVKVEKEKLYQQIGIKSHGKGLFHKEFVDGKALGNKRVFWVKENAFIVNIVFAWEQAVGKTTAGETGMIASHRFPMYIPVEDQSNLNYLVYFFLTKRGKFLLELASPGGAGRNKTLGQKEFENLKFLIPCLHEQEKIALFLSTADDKIQQLNDKKALLEKYKKGVMQQIFSQQIRFKDDNGNDFPEWEEKKLSALMFIPEKEKPTSVDLNKLLTVRLHLKGIQRNSNTDNLVVGATNYYVRRKGQFIYGKQNLFKGAFGIIPEEFEGYLSSGDIPTLDIDQSKLNPYFLMYYLGRESYYKRLEDIASGSGSKRIHEATFLNVKIDLPSVKEQQKITNFLTSIDTKINYTSNQLDQAQQFKKGLLQQMFV